MSDLLHVEYNTLSRADGSAVYCDDRTVLMVAVYGPVDVSTSRENWERASVNCVFKKRISINKADPNLKFIENFICSTLESSIYGHLYPRTSINIIIQELQSRNSLIAPALNASICALMDAGISQKYLIAAVNIGVMRNIDATYQLILNPNLDQLAQCVTNLTFVLDNQEYKLISVLHEGSLSIELFDRALQMAKQACEEIFKFYKNSIRNKFLAKRSQESNAENDESMVQG